ncbi:MAG: hypothetical protein EBS01_01605 [Verrucomicrobia bacterium]|nr:hypothetical protein [Verrucomicrobiota bacterium]
MPGVTSPRCQPSRAPSRTGSILINPATGAFAILAQKHEERFSTLAFPNKEVFSATPGGYPLWRFSQLSGNVSP